MTEPDFDTAAVSVCFLPDQIAIFVYYGVLFVGTLITLALTTFFGFDWTEDEPKRPKSPTISNNEVPIEEVVWESGVNGSTSPMFYEFPKGQKMATMATVQLRIRHLYPIYLSALGHIVMYGSATYVLCVMWEHLY